MKILFASDSFKGSLSSEKIVELLEEVTHKVFPDAVTEGILVADGGEGTMVPPEKRNPLKATSFGTGMLIKDALEQGIRDIVIAIGGSATNDGGMGALSALGVRFLDEEGTVLRGCGGDLERVRIIDLNGMHPAVLESTFTVMCDVTNPLLGKEGATYTFGMQKGADLPMLERLECGMKNYAAVVERTISSDRTGEKGAGAAGGMGFALMTFLNAELKSGIETVLELVGFDEKLKGAELVITGEGRMDWQSSFGKVPAGIGKRCKQANIPAVAIVGGLLDGYQEIYETGICSVVTTVNGVMTLEDAIEQGEELYKDAAFRLLSAIKCGMRINIVF